MSIDDYVGQRFGTRICIGVQRKNGRAKLLMLCDCGKQSTIRSWKPEVFRCNSCVKIKHSGSRSPTYNSWLAMLARCTNKEHKSYGQYGGLGIGVCERWEDFNLFVEDMGLRPPRTTLDRIDNSLGYCKENCRWATPEQQQRNRCNNHLLTLRGETRCLAEWAELYNVPPTTILSRFNRGCRVEQILAPSRSRRKQDDPPFSYDSDEWDGDGEWYDEWSDEWYE